MRDLSPADTRTLLGLSIADMAVLMNVHRETWAKWENGTRNPNEAAKTLMSVFVWLHGGGLLDDYRSLSE